MKSLPIKTPAGPFILAADDEGIVLCTTEDELDFWEKKFSGKLSSCGADADTHLRKAEQAVDAYFSGNKAALSKVQLKPIGSEFQRSVWQELRQIPLGQTASYSTISERVGRPKAIRAVGTACGDNPLLFFVPCHRVITKGGTLGGFRGGLETKKFLLAHENDSCHSSYQY